MSFPRYPEYKDSGVEWFGEMPAHWSVAPMKYLTTFRSGGTPSKENSTFWNGDIPWASAKDIKSEYLSDTLDHVTNDAVEKGGVSLIEDGAVLVVVRGMILAHTFPVTIAMKPMAINQDLKAIVPSEKLTGVFLGWYLRGCSEELLRRTDEAGHGTKALRMNALASLELIAPTIPEQITIAAFLDFETAQIDALIAEQERLIELLKEKRQALISHAVTKGLNPDAPMKDSEVEWLGEVPAHWQTPPLYNRYRIELGKMLDESRISGNYLIPYLRNIDVQWDTINISDLPEMDIHEKEYERYTLKPNDLLVCEGGEVGRSAIFQIINLTIGFQKALHRLRPLDSDDLIRFMYYTLYWASNFGIFLADGNPNTIPHLTGEKLRRYRFPKPPLIEQLTIADFLDHETAKIDELIAEANRAVELLKERRSALISAAVTGQIDVRGWVKPEYA